MRTSGKIEVHVKPQAAAQRRGAPRERDAPRAGGGWGMQEPFAVSPKMLGQQALLAGIERSPRVSAQRQVVQRLATVGGAEASNHTMPYAAKISEHAGTKAGHVPVLMEVMEGDKDQALGKIQAIAESRGEEADNRAIMIGLNEKVTTPKLVRAKNGTDSPASLISAAEEVAQAAEDAAVIGGCFPVLFPPTGPDGGYTFPFLEMRAQVTLHPGTQELITRLSNTAEQAPVARSMDADVKDDPLLTGTFGDLSAEAQEQLKKLAPQGEEGLDVVSGGYAWDEEPPAASAWKALKRSATGPQVEQWRGRYGWCMHYLNRAEHEVRTAYAKIQPKAVYWPEPNTYMHHTTHTEGARAALGRGNESRTAQQRESTFYLKGIRELKGKYLTAISTTKPRKTYLDDLTPLVMASTKDGVAPEPLGRFIDALHQSHLGSGHLENIQNWMGFVLDETAKGQMETARLKIVVELKESLGLVLKKVG